jgi:uncharacterized protein (DUF362 family)
MVDTGLKLVSGQSDIKQAWLSILPGLNASSKILIKPNAFLAPLSTRFELIQMICQSLMALDLGGSSLQKENICIYECTWDGQAGISLAYGNKMSQLDVTWDSADRAGFSLPFMANDYNHYMTQLVDWADYIINMSIMKAREDVCGITGLLKNHMGTVSSSTSRYSIYETSHSIAAGPEKCLNPFIGEIFVAQNNALINKSLLNITDGIWARYGGNAYMSSPQSWQSFDNKNPCLLLFSRDPVAADTAHLDITNQERALRLLNQFSLQPDPANFPDSSHILSVEAVGGGSTDYNLIINDGSTDLTSQLQSLRQRIKLQTSPNPMTGAANIYFYLPQSGEVKLDILSLQGRIVKTLLNKRFMKHGLQKVHFDSRDTGYKIMAPGIYVARLRFNKIESFTKLQIIR